MMLKKTAAVLLAAMAVSAAAAVTSFGGEWKLDAGKYWYDTGSGYLANGIHAIEGAFYSFDPAGYMETGWQDEGGKWYYFDPASGAQVRGWLQVGDKWYYLDPMDGAMRTGIVEILNKLYYFNPDGAMHAPGIFHSEDGTKTYRASEDGSLYRNKADVDLENNYTVRYDENGVMYTANEHSRLVAEAGGEKFREVMNEENAAERGSWEEREASRHREQLNGKPRQEENWRILPRRVRSQLLSMTSREGLITRVPTEHIRPFTVKDMMMTLTMKTMKTMKTKTITMRTIKNKNG